MSTLSVFVFAISLILFYKFLDWFLKRREFYKKIDYLPGPRSFPIIGNAYEIKSCEDILPVLIKHQKQYGNTFTFHLGPDPYVFTADPQIIEALTSSSTQVTKSNSYEFLKKWLGNGLVSSNNPRWHLHRRMITPSFHFNILKDFLPIFHKNSLNLVEHWKKTAGDTRNPKHMDVFEDISSCALDIICETAMGVSVNALKDGKQSKYMESIKFLGRTVFERVFSVWMRFDFLYQFSSWAKLENASVGEIKRTTKEVIQRKRAELNANGGKVNKMADSDVGAKPRLAFLDYMMQAQNESGSGMTDEELSEEVDTIIFAGHDTTATTSAYVLYYLGCNPEVQEKLFEEISNQFDHEEPTYEQLSNLKYLEMVIKETMRIMPTFPMFLRLLTEDVVYNGYHFPKGLNIACFVYGSHTNPEIFEEPEKFIPERFTLENVSKRHPFAYIPFSAGPRNCIGQKYAMLEMKCLLAVLVRHFKFAKAPGVDIQPCAEGIMKSANGVQLLVEVRN